MMSRMSAPSTTPLTVTLEAAFAGFTFMPWASFAHNSINPVLVLHPDHIEYRVLRLRSRPYAEVVEVDYRHTFATHNIVLRFKDSVRTFIGNAGLERRAREAITVLRGKGCALSERAERLVGPP